MSNDYGPNQGGYDQNNANSGPGGYGGASAYPNSQPSGGYPGSQGSAPYGGQTNSWGDPTGQRSAGYVDEIHGQHDPGQWAPAGAAPVQAQPPAPNQDDNFFKSLFDFGFTRYATPSIIKIYYIVGIIIGGLYWLGGALMMGLMGTVASSATDGDSSGSGIMAFLWFLFGAPAYFFYIVALRVQLEFMLAAIRTNQDTKAIRAHLGA